MHSYAASLKALFDRNANPAHAEPMKKYMRDQFEYLGIRSPQVNALLKQFIRQQGTPAPKELAPILHELWGLPEREYQYAGIGLMARLEKKLPAEAIGTLEYMIRHRSWWDTVDNISHIVGVHFRRYPDVRTKYLAKWRASSDLWIRRTTLLFQLDYREDTDFDLLEALIRENLGSDEFFINKAIGWSLRQYARVEPETVKKFVSSTPLHPLSRREALKHLQE